MAAAGNDTCILDIRETYRFSFRTSATVIEVKQRLAPYMKFDVFRLIVFVLPERTKMENEATLASYGIKAGETTSLAVEIEIIDVYVQVLGPNNLATSIKCYQWSTVSRYKLLIVDWLRNEWKVRGVGPEDMELYVRNGNRMSNEAINLSDYGVGNMSWIDVKITKEWTLHSRPTSAL